MKNCKDVYKCCGFFGESFIYGKLKNRIMERGLKEYAIRILVILLVISLFAGTYALTNEFTVGREVAVLNTPLDDLIPFIPFFVYFYLFTYVMNTIGISLVVINEKTGDFKRSIIGFVFLILISSLIYILFPVKTIRPEFVVNSFTTNIVNSLYAAALPYNLFPSLHVSLSIFSTILAFRFKKAAGYIFAVFTFLITLSTLFIKQHYIMDLVAAVILAMIGYWLMFGNVFSMKSLFYVEKPDYIWKKGAMDGVDR